MTASALYEGTIRHRRFAASPGGFTHRLGLAYIDLEELPSLLGGLLVRERGGIVRLRRSDYLGDPAVPLDAAVRALVAERTGRAPAGPVRLLAGLRTLGRCYNPVSFYYCHAADGTLETLVAEVTNTPWGERHAYVLPATGEISRIHGDLAKALHVSPFMGMDQRYEIAATEPGRTLSVHIASREDGRRAFDATLALRRLPLTRRGLAGAVARRPMPSLRVLALIYAHALGLRLRGVPVHPHPA
jgi:DUF1365 family protein